jgi:hypothetical protein
VTLADVKTPKRPSSASEQGPQVQLSRALRYR